MNKLLLHITLIGSLFQLPNLFGQPPINQRYVIDDETNSIFGSVISTDSCYYLSGVQLSSPFSLSTNGSFMLCNFDGTIDELFVIENDTLGIDLWLGSNLLATLDNKFSCFVVADEIEPIGGFMFIKLDANGEVIVSKYFNEFYLEDGNIGKNPSTLIQHADSTYYGLVHVQREEDLLGGVVFFRLDKNGNLMYKQNFYGESIETYNILRSASMVQFNENKFIIGAAYCKDHLYAEDARQHTKLIVVDSLGEILEERTYWDDPLSFDCKGLTKTPDGGLLYCGRIGQYFPDFGGYNDYKLRIVKLNSDFEEEWEIELGEYTILSYLGFNQIKPINDSEYVAVGFHTTSEDYQTGVLVKFNLSGEKIWERRYRKIPKYGSDIAQHRLYDVDITPDNGFVMVGDAINHYETEDLPGQKAWLIKVDSFGCLVPGCHELDLGISENITNYESVQVYPNPATNSLFYYHHQDNFDPVQVTIFSANGQTVQTWQINTNDITCEVDVSDFQVGMYILKVTDKKGVVLETQQFVKK